MCGRLVGHPGEKIVEVRKEILVFVPDFGKLAGNCLYLDCDCHDVGDSCAQDAEE